MIRIKTNVLMVVAPATSSIPVPAGKQVVYIDDICRLFPTIHQLQPGAVILDYDYLGGQTEKILRRIAINQFYSKIKIYCYKTKPHSKVDALLKVLGVYQFIYAQDIAQQRKHNSPIKTLSELFKSTLHRKLADANY